MAEKEQELEAANSKVHPLQLDFCCSVLMTASMSACSLAVDCAGSHTSAASICADLKPSPDKQYDSTKGCISPHGAASAPALQPSTQTHPASVWPQQAQLPAPAVAVFIGTISCCPVLAARVLQHDFQHL